jgi:hypothetical protein
MVTVLKAGSGKKAKAEIEPGTTARDVLELLGLEGFSLGKADESSPFGADEEIYPRVVDGEKLHATPDTPVREGRGTDIVSGVTSAAC